MNRVNAYFDRAAEPWRFILFLLSMLFLNWTTTPQEARM
jgi:hypothetical protein